MNTQEALRELFTEHTNRELSEITGENYYTVTSWKFKFKHNQLSMEKQIEILTKTNHKINTNLTWKRKAKLTA
jgi:hypothetical protein